EAVAAFLQRRDGYSRIVVWAHNSHLGDARATAMGEEGELNVGQLVREKHGDAALLVGFTTYEGTVTAADDWGGSPQRMTVRPALPGSVEELFHEVVLPRFFLPLRGAGEALGELRPAPGESVNGDAFQEAAGGKGANQAVGAARLGAKVALVARVGRDARGDAVLAKLHDESVETRFVTRDPEQPTGVALCQVAASGEKQILSAAGANARLTSACVREAAAAIGSARVVLCQLGVPLDAVEEAVRLGR